MTRRRKDLKTFSFTTKGFEMPITSMSSSDFSTTGYVDFSKKRKRGRKRATKPSRKVSRNKKRTRKTSR